MKRDPRAYLLDIQEPVEAIQSAVAGITLEQYEQSRLIRSSVEREFIIIGEALAHLSRRDPDLFSSIEEAPQIISFRNKLTHEYVTINHQLVWGVIQHDLQPLHISCQQWLQQLESLRRYGHLRRYPLLAHRRPVQGRELATTTDVRSATPGRVWTRRSRLCRRSRGFAVSVVPPSPASIAGA